MIMYSRDSIRTYGSNRNKSHPPAYRPEVESVFEK